VQDVPGFDGMDQVVPTESQPHSGCMPTGELLRNFNKLKNFNKAHTHIKQIERRCVQSRREERPACSTEQNVTMESNNPSVPFK